MSEEQEAPLPGERPAASAANGEDPLAEKEHAAMMADAEVAPPSPPELTQEQRDTLVREQYAALLENQAMLIRAGDVVGLFYGSIHADNSVTETMLGPKGSDRVRVLGLLEDFYLSAKSQLMRRQRQPAMRPASPEEIAAIMRAQQAANAPEAPPA